MKIINSDTGYRAEELDEIKAVFEKAAVKLFGEENIMDIEHFNYGETIDMAAIHLADGNYGDFNITAKRVSFNGHTCTNEEYKKFTELTFNDELFKGRLFKI